ncbi:site-specific DNA-methyltransferase [Afipia massiliensis]|nr:DNA methyltransferase [Afipia massiliensis]
MLNVQWVPIGTLKQNPRNVRTHKKNQIKQIADSIRTFGWTFPILTDEMRMIVAGTGRYLASTELRLREVPIIIKAGLTETQKRALALADNKIAANAGWDHLGLAAELGELATLLPECNLDLRITGFEAPEIDNLMGAFSDSEQDPVDEISRPADIAITRRGDLWTLGRHQLYCGDSGDPVDVRTLMRRQMAHMVFADPPYNVPVRSIQGRGKIKHREFSSASGEMSPKQFTSFLAKWMRLAVEFSEDGSIHFCCMDWRHMSEVLAASEETYSELKNLIVWAKSNAGQGSFYRSQHELIFVFKNGDRSHQNNIELGKHGRSRSNVWQYAGVNTFRKDRLAELTVHPTVKPVALVADAMRDCSRRNDIIYDPFMGSGTTILAAEKVGRRAYGIEIDPLYVDVAIRRWQEFTKRDAILEATGQTFDEVAAKQSASPALKRVRT